MKLFDSEWKVMEVLWRENDLTAKEVSLRLAESIGWNKNTTYTVLKKCIDKGAIERREPNFVCHAAITKAQAQKEEADSLLDKVFGGSAELLFASILPGCNQILTILFHFPTPLCVQQGAFCVAHKIVKAIFQMQRGADGQKLIRTWNRFTQLPLVKCCSCNFNAIL